MDPEEPQVGLATWGTAGQWSVAAEIQVEQMPGSQRGKSARAEDQPRLNQGIRRRDGIGEDQDTIA